VIKCYGLTLRWKGNHCTSFKRHKERKLTEEDIFHFLNVVSAINETIDLMAQIDEVIDEHGG
jgi:hypothetical protein